MATTRNKFTEFFETLRVFNTAEFKKHCTVTGYHARNTLVKYMQSRHIRKLRNKFYTVLSEGTLILSHHFRYLSLENQRKMRF